MGIWSEKEGREASKLVMEEQMEGGRGKEERGGREIPMGREVEVSTYA